MVFGTWVAVPLTFPLHLREVIRATPTPMASSASDRLVWTSSSTRKFDARNAYSLACNDTPNPAFFGGNWNWRVDTLPKIQTGTKLGFEVEGGKYNFSWTYFFFFLRNSWTYFLKSKIYIYYLIF